MRTEELRNLAAVMILGDSSLTDELTDKEAKSLLDLGVQQANAAVDALLSSSVLPPDNAEEMIAERMAPVRGFLGAINRIVGKRRGLTPEQMTEELETLRAAAQELPLQPEAPVSDSALSLLAHWPAETDNLGFVLAMLHAFGPGQAAEIDTGDEPRR
ncbi:MAG: hypothetical protein ACK2U9_24105 [Anaerolineae bacterium]